eukprot:2517414-Prymnesium_polylepis.1
MSVQWRCEKLGSDTVLGQSASETWSYGLLRAVCAIECTGALLRFAPLVKGMDSLVPAKNGDTSCSSALNGTDLPPRPLIYGL